MHNAHKITDLVKPNTTPTSSFAIPPFDAPCLSWSTSFNSASELAAAMLRLGKEFDIHQLSSGPLQGHFSVVHLDDLSLFSIQTNQLLLFNGDRGKDCTSFSLEISGNYTDHRIHSETISPYSLHGFKPDLSESHFQLTAGSTSVFAVTSSKKFNTFVERCGHDSLLEILHNSNSLQLHPDSFAAISKHFSWQLNNPLSSMELRTRHTEQLYSLLLDTLTKTQHNNFKTFEIAPRQQIIQELVRWGFRNSSTPIKLDDVSSILYSSRRTLIQGCKENFQIRPMELLRSIRLEQVNWALRSNETRKSLDLNKIGEIANHFGFTSRGHFSAAYQNHFGETPRQTLKNANL